jgi:triacylglycerol lipase
MTTQKHHPIILAHGITRPDYIIDFIKRKMNFQGITLVSEKFHYFKGIASFLRHHGFEVYHTSVSFAADIETRARDLTREINKILANTGHQKLHIIGHSMGGLDARHMIVNHSMAYKVASLTTIGTPHLGTSVADWFIQIGLDKIVGTIRNVINLEGFRSLTTKACREFNDFARDAEAANSVVYQVYASAQKRELTFRLFQKTWQITYDKEGDNEGLVSVKSQKWEDRLVGKNGAVKIIKQHVFPMPADHVNQMGWWHWNGAHWNARILKEKKEFEMAIKNVYLQIAREVTEDN